MQTPPKKNPLIAKRPEWPTVAKPRSGGKAETVDGRSPPEQLPTRYNCSQ